MKRNYWVEIISSLFILLFVYTATSKFMDFINFRSMLYGSPWVGQKAPVVAWVVPLSEIAIALLLFFPKTRRLGLWSSLLIMTLFTVYIGYMLYFSPTLPCNCGGVISQMTWKQHFIFNIFFTLLAAAGLLVDRKIKMEIRPPLEYRATI